MSALLELVSPSATTENEREASVCIRRHQAAAVCVDARGQQEEE
jgi:hypothetical protein